MAISRFGSIVIGMLFVALPQLIGEIGNSNQQGPVARVNLYDYVSVPAGDLTVAKVTVERIFRQAGLDIVWIDVPVSGKAEAALRHTGRRLGSADLRVRILPEPKIPDWAKKTHQVAFSLLPNTGGFGILSSIYWERLQKIARRENRPVGLVLGCVIAHELGHLLLRMKGHGRSGIMSFPVTGQYLSQASLGRLAFTTAQAKRLQREVWKRISWDRETAGPTVEIAGTQLRTRAAHREESRVLR